MQPAKAALLSVLVPGLGQWLVGDRLMALLWFFLSFAGYWLILPGVFFHACSVMHAYFGYDLKK